MTGRRISVATRGRHPGPATSGRRVRMTVAVLACVLIAGCAQPGPQAPKPAAKKLNDATSNIASACGNAEALTAFSGSHAPSVASEESSALTGVRDLVDVFATNRTWIYQGETVNGIVSDSILLLGDCGLPRAQRALEAAISRH